MYGFVRRSFKICLSYCHIFVVVFFFKEPSEKSNIYIPHKYADEPQGDKLGVQIWTYIIKLKDGTIYHQHFFVGVDKDGPADKMKIR